MRATAARALAWQPADSASRSRDLSLLFAGTLWLLYTRLYFFLHPRHLTFDGGLFMWLFNKPDPGCGLTRTFAWMWQGNVRQAVLIYPLGPLLFVAVLLLVGYCAVGLTSGRRLSLNFSIRTWTWIFVIAGIALGLNWASKLIWLGM